MRESLSKIFNTATIKQSSVTLIGTIINGFLGLLFFVLAARFLGPSEFGILALSLAVATLLADVTDFGISSSVVRFINNQKIIKLGLTVKIFTAILVIILGLVLAPWVVMFVFNKPQFEQPFQLAVIAAATTLLFNFSLSVLQALQRFKIWSSLQVATNLLRVIFLAILITSQNLNIYTALLAYVISPLIGFCLSFLFIPKNFFREKNVFEIVPTVFDYSKWIALTIFISALSSRIEIFISGKYLTSAEIGYYSAASQLTLVVPQIMRSIETVISPKIAGMLSIKEMTTYVIKSQLLVCALALLLIGSAPIINIFLPFIYGDAYATFVTPIFFILVIAMAIFLMGVPVNSAIMYYFSYSKLFVFISIIHLVSSLLLGLVLIPQYQAVGAALTVLFGIIINLLISYVWFIKRISDEK